MNIFWFICNLWTTRHSFYEELLDLEGFSPFRAMWALWYFLCNKPSHNLPEMYISMVHISYTSLSLYTCLFCTRTGTIATSQSHDQWRGVATLAAVFSLQLLRPHVIGHVTSKKQSKMGRIFILRTKPTDLGPRKSHKSPINWGTSL